MNLIEAFDLKEKLETRINAYWTYWSVAIFAVGGWIFAENGNVGSHKTLLIVGVIVFFLSNLGVLWPATKLITGLQDEIRIKSKGSNIDSDKLKGILRSSSSKVRLEITLFLHIAVDVLVVILISVS